MRLYFATRVETHIIINALDSTDLEKDHTTWQDSLRATCGGKKGTIRNVDDDEMDGVDPEGCCTHLFLMMAAEWAALHRPTPKAEDIAGTISVPLIKTRKALASALVPTRQAALVNSFRRGHDRGEGIFAATQLLTATMSAGMLKKDMPDASIESTKAKMKKAHKHARQVFGKKAAYVKDHDDNDSAEAPASLLPGKLSPLPKLDQTPDPPALNLDNQHDASAYHGHARAVAGGAVPRISMSPRGKRAAGRPRSNSGERISQPKASGSSSARRSPPRKSKNAVHPEAHDESNVAHNDTDQDLEGLTPRLEALAMSPSDGLKLHLTPRNVLPAIPRNQPSEGDSTTVVEMMNNVVEMIDNIDVADNDMVVTDIESQPVAPGMSLEEYTAASSKLREAFDMFDSDHSGTLERSEFRMILTGGEEEEDGTLTDAQFDAVYASVDRDGDGFINFDEYIQWSLGPAPATQ